MVRRQQNRERLTASEGKVQGVPQTGNQRDRREGQPARERKTAEQGRDRVEETGEERKHDVKME